MSRHSPARPAPIESEPVSPMMIRAGAAFHHRKPRHPPTSATATSAEVERVACEVPTR